MMIKRIIIHMGEGVELSRRELLGAGGAACVLALTGCQSVSHATKASASAAPLLLNFNENALGVPPSCMRALSQQLPQAFLYPDAPKAEFMAALAQYHGVTAEQLIYGNGSSEVLKMAVDAMVTNAIDNAGVKVTEIQLVMPDPSYGVVADYASARGVKVVAVPLNSELQIDLVAMQAQVDSFNGCSIIYLCNPNNPTSLLMATDPLQAWLAQASVKLQFIVDEAYGEYANPKTFVSAVAAVKAENPYLVVTRTFSKIYGLAGLRVGYGVAHPQMIVAMTLQASIDNANLAGCVAATAALSDNTWLALSLASQARALALVTQTLDALGLKHLDCNANFMFHRVNGDTDLYQQRMKAAGILVGRKFNHTNGWNRLTLGTPEQMEKFCRTLIQFRQQGWV
ncbi:MAG: pyridoxal phosphate-dependent aminotransferase [Shewanella sp.]